MTRPKHTTDGEPPADGHWDASAPKPVDSSGQHGAYWVLPEADRKRGFVRPVRRSYIHVGPKPPHGELRDLTFDEQTRFAGLDYVKFEAYPDSESSVVGRYWTQAQVDSVSGCGAMTTMGIAIAETYARDPGYYKGGTFCCKCRDHFPLDEFVWDGTNEKVGT